jgi:hypothetical protein
MFDFNSNNLIESFEKTWVTYVDMRNVNNPGQGVIWITSYGTFLGPIRFIAQIILCLLIHAYYYLMSNHPD